MARKKQKYYVVWVGLEPGIYDNWEDCAEQVLTYPGAKYKSFDSMEAAVAAYRGDDTIEGKTLLGILEHSAPMRNFAAFPEIDLQAIAVDAACSANPGPMEYRGVEVGSGREIFHFGPVEEGTNNIGEYLALIHALALLEQKGQTGRRIYTDSKTALAWLRRGHSNTSMVPTARNARLMNLLARADRWLASHRVTNPITKWKTEEWGEIPADFGRK